MPRLHHITILLAGLVNLRILLLAYARSCTLPIILHVLDITTVMALHHRRSSPRDRMAIGFLAPQDTEATPSKPRPMAGAQGHRAEPASRPQLQARVYGVNVEASLARPCNVFPVTPSSHHCPTSHPGQAPEPPNYYSSQSESPPTPSLDQISFSDRDRLARERRDPYSEEMKFFIMFARIIREQEWRRIEEDFERLFRQRRPRDGLTAVYYRIRKEWGMQRVLSSGPDKHESSLTLIKARAQGLSQQLLRDVGYALH